MYKKGVCRHFSGIQNDACDNGINYREHDGGPMVGIATRIPCFKVQERANGPIVPCQYYEEYTQGEIDEWNESVKAKLTAMLDAICAIHKKHSVKTEWESPTGTNKASKGIIECPLCKGRLHYTIASFNGHIWGQCETEGCLSWMQ